MLYTLGTASLSLGIKTKFILNVFDFLLINFWFYLFIFFIFLNYFILSIPWASWHSLYLGSKLLLYLVEPPMLFSISLLPYLPYTLIYISSPSSHIIIPLPSPVILPSRHRQFHKPPNPPPNGIEMCNFFKNFYIYSTCSNPAAHFLRTEMEGTKDNTTCNDGPHDRFIVVVGKCVLCSSAR